MLAAFTQPEPGPEFILPNGVVIPEGTDYGWVYYHPLEKKALISHLDDDSALIDLDIAIELVTDIYPSILIYTRAYFIRVSLDGLPQDEHWAQQETFLREKLNK